MGRRTSRTCGSSAWYFGGVSGIPCARTHSHSCQQASSLSSHATADCIQNWGAHAPAAHERASACLRSYFCVTTNLSRGETSVHRAGPLAKLVRASMTIVGLVPPVFEEGELLIDGGYSNNIPVDVMHAQGAAA